MWFYIRVLSVLSSLHLVLKRCFRLLIWIFATLDRGTKLTKQYLIFILSCKITHTSPVLKCYHHIKITLEGCACSKVLTLYGRNKNNIVSNLKLTANIFLWLLMADGGSHLFSHNLSIYFWFKVWCTLNITFGKCVGILAGENPFFLFILFFTCCEHVFAVITLRRSAGRHFSVCFSPTAGDELAKTRVPASYE